MIETRDVVEAILYRARDVLRECPPGGEGKALLLAAAALTALAKRLAPPMEWEGLEADIMRLSDDIERELKKGELP